ncbi:hypothetical protein OH710_19585 [Pseudomonas capsici]|uniref:hypothetical protein n=1 Tax=Pseudomonas capsici TaxID=2810614 RepID=UPI001C8AA4E2|nr:hypothetical protein [Pseudomonas capsici]MBX8477117.1 hypothetical protein [Pseudomonas cichorii]MCV4274848.1 hypothetical protein [Pseudomonas capsici]
MNTYQKNNCRSPFKKTHEQFARMFELPDISQDNATSLRARFRNILKAHSNDLKPDTRGECAQRQPHNTPDFIPSVTRPAASRNDRFH